MRETPRYMLPLWDGEDKSNWMIYNEAMATIDQGMYENSQRIYTGQQDIITINTWINGTNVTLATMQNDIDKNTKNITANKTDITELQQFRSTTENTIRNLQAKDNELSSSVSSLQTSVATNATNIARIDNTSKANATDIQALQQVDIGLVNRISGLESVVTGAPGWVDISVIPAGLVTVEGHARYNPHIHLMFARLKFHSDAGFVKDSVIAYFGNEANIVGGTAYDAVGFNGNTGARWAHVSWRDGLNAQITSSSNLDAMTEVACNIITIVN